MSPETSRTSLWPRATALITEARPVRRATSPVNSPVPGTATVFGASSESSIVAISPARDYVFTDDGKR
jgi:hypothetical protein